MVQIVLDCTVWKRSGGYKRCTHFWPAIYVLQGPSPASWASRWIPVLAKRLTDSQVAGLEPRFILWHAKGRKCGGRDRKWREQWIVLFVSNPSPPNANTLQPFWQKTSCFCLVTIIPSDLHCCHFPVWNVMQYWVTITMIKIVSNFKYTLPWLNLGMTLIIAIKCTALEDTAVCTSVWMLKSPPSKYKN